MQDTGSKVDGFGSLPPNFSSVPFTGRLEPGYRQKRKKYCSTLWGLSWSVSWKFCSTFIPTTFLTPVKLVIQYQCVYITLIELDIENCQLMMGKSEHCSGTRAHTQILSQTRLCVMRYSLQYKPEVSTNRQIVLVRVEEVVQVVDGHHQVCLVDQAGGGHAVVSSPPLTIYTNILTVNAKKSRI